MKKLNLTAILIGFLGSFIASIIIELTITLMFRSVDLVQHNYSPFSRKFYTNLVDKPEFLASIFIAGCACYVIGGWLAARVEKKYLYPSAIVVGCLWMAFDIAALVVFGHAPDFLDLADMFSTIPLAYAGAKLAEWNARS